MDLTTLPDPTAPDWGAQLRAWRLAAGLTQSALSVALGVPLDTLRHWEQRKMHPAKMTTGRRRQSSPHLERIQALRRGA